MRILNRKEFLSISHPVVYSIYTPHAFDGLYVKGNTIKDENRDIDYYLFDLVCPIECENWEDESNKLNEAQNKKTDIILNFDIEERDGIYDEEELYAVYSKDDVKQLIEIFKKTL